MKRLILAIAITATALSTSAFTGCSQNLPKPHDAETTVASAYVAYGLAAHSATTYITNCHRDMTQVGCNSAVIDRIKSTDQLAFDSIRKADNAVATGSSGADAQIAEMKKNLAAFQTATKPTQGAN